MDNINYIDYNCFYKIVYQVIISGNFSIGLYVNKIFKEVYYEILYKILDIKYKNATLLYIPDETYHESFRNKYYNNIHILYIIRSLIKNGKGYWSDYYKIKQIVYDLFGKDNLKNIKNLHGKYQFTDTFCDDVLKNKHLFMLPNCYKVGNQVMSIKKKYINTLIRNRIHRNKIGY